MERNLADWLSLRRGDEPIQWVAGAVIVDGQGRAFVQRRSTDRRLFPGCWDVVGGHVEAGETVRECLDREIAEETGWQLREVVALLGTWDWVDPDGRPKRDIDFLVTVDGDLDLPRLEREKHPEFRWVDAADLDVLGDGRQADDTFIFDLVRTALERPVSE